MSRYGRFFMRRVMTVAAAIAAFGLGPARELVKDGSLHVYRDGPGKRTVSSGVYRDRSRYTPAMVRRLGAVRGVGRPPSVLAKRRAKA